MSRARQFLSGSGRAIESGSKGRLEVFDPRAGEKVVKRPLVGPDAGHDEADAKDESGQEAREVTPDGLSERQRPAIHADYPDLERHLSQRLTPEPVEDDVVACADEGAEELRRASHRHPRAEPPAPHDPARAEENALSHDQDDPVDQDGNGADPESRRP